MVTGGPRSQSVRACGAKRNPWADGQELNVKDYREDRVWVILMNTTADAANK